MSIFLITNVLGLRRVKGEVANGCDQAIDAKSYDRKKQICQGSGCVTLRFQTGVVDDKTTNPTKEKGQEKASQFVVVHFSSPPKNDKS